MTAGSIGGADDDALRQDDRRERERVQRVQYRERNAERIAEYKRRWRERNAAHIRAYRAAYDAAHRDEILPKKREYARGYEARKRAEARRQENRRIKARERYATRREEYLDTQRRYRQRRRAEDPEGYRAQKRERNRRWLDSHRDEQNARLREKYRNDREPRRRAAERYYANHAEEVKARRRAYYWAHREESLAKQAVWRERERRRRAAGLPPRRLHRVAAAERTALRAEADLFFNRPRTTEEVRALRRERIYPNPEHAEDLQRWDRDSARQRAAHALATDPSVQRKIQRDAERRTIERFRIERIEHAQAEVERMEAIARQINDRLRTQPRQRPPAIDTAAPPYGPASTQRGLGL